MRGRPAPPIAPARTGVGLLAAAVAAAGVLSMVVSAGPAAGQEPSDLDSFLRAVEHTARRLADVEVAISEGYRKLGPDFPGMGEHWVHPGLVIAGRVDPEHPPVVAYTTVGTERRLVGFAFTRVLGPDDAVPGGPFPKDTWHDHTGGVDEESLLLSGPASMHGADHGYRLSMVHVWMPLTNPEGVLAQNNWNLPFYREGLAAPPGVSSEAARALSLAGVGAPFYEKLLREGIGLRGAELAAALDVFSVHGRRARSWLERHRSDGALTPDALVTLESIWSDLWRDIEASVSGDAHREMLVLRSD